MKINDKKFVKYGTRITAWEVKGTLHLFRTVVLREGLSPSFASTIKNILSNLGNVFSLRNI